MTERGYIVQRGKLKAQLTRFGAFIREFDNKDAEVGELGARLEKIEAVWEAFDKCQLEIEIMSDDDPAQLQERVIFEEAYYKSVGKAKQIISAHNQNTREAAIVTPGVTSIGTPVPNLESQVKLPTLKLPEFLGDYANFNQFKECFNSLIHENVSLSNVQKFHYLRSCLKSDAALVLQNLQTTDANYAVAWELIRERYENKRATINGHIKAIVEMECLTKESAPGLRKLYDTTLKNTRSLKNLEESVDQWDTILIYLGASKLDYVTKRDWESSIKKGTMPRLEEFMEFLASRCHILETLKVDKNIHCNKFRKIQNTPRIQTHLVQKQPCVACKGDHSIYVCSQFKSLSVYERFAKAKSLRLCLNCLRSNHNARDCHSQGCKTCGEKHNTLLHFKQSNSNNQNKDPPTEEPGASLALNSCYKHTDKHIVLLSTAEIMVFDSNKKQVKCRALLDSGSQSNFMTKSLATRLNLIAQKISMPIMGIGQTNSHISYKTSAIIKSTHNGYKADLSFFILPTITGNVPNYTVSSYELNIPANLTLADAEFYNSRPIDLLLGAGIFYELLCVGQIKLGPGQPIMQKSKFGWLLAGPMRLPTPEKATTCLFSSATREVQEQLERFWTIEEVSEQKILTEDERLCEEHFARTHTRDMGGRFEVELPLRSNYKQLGHSREIATKRYLSIERKLNRDFELREQYNRFLAEYEALGHMTRIDTREIDNGLNYYLPHHSVINESSATTRLRVVFDASSKGTGGLSLNDVLLVGPTLQEDLFSIIVRFRTHNFVITADIQKMYRQINVCREHRDLQRIVWRPKPSEELAHFRLNTVTYGTASASYLAIKCLNQCAIENENKYPIASKIILRDFYVDDLLTGANTRDELSTLKNEIVSILETGGFKLHKWMSNDSDAQSPIYHPLLDENKKKTLGVYWNPSKDSLKYSICLASSTQRITKRTILSLIGQIFDPLGLLGPIIIRAKILLQELWKIKLSWDESVPVDIHTQWVVFSNQLPILSKLEIPRLIKVPNAVKIEIHGFSDASEKAYGACIYVKSIENNGNCVIRLLCAKSRVAPLKSLSIPRLELCAALLMVKLVKKIAPAIALKIDNFHYWTDSSIVLAWLAREPSCWKTFVANRIAEIQNLTKNACWHHVISSQNPADVLSRGTDPERLISDSLWWCGPEWLKENTPQKEPNMVETDENIPERRAIHALVSVCEVVEFNIFTRFSQLNKLQRVIAYVLRFIHNAKNSERRVGNLAVFEMRNSLNLIIQLVQKQSYAFEIECLKSRNNLSRKHKLLSLNPFVGADGLLRVGGRIKGASLPYDQVHQILLPSKHHVVRLLIEHEHRRRLHAGCQAVMCALRQKYWIVDARSIIRQILKKCVVCFKANPKSANELMGDLPAHRLTPIRPFVNCGVDFAGPFTIKDGKTRTRKYVKAYVCVFVCFSTKAVHLELAADLTTDAFLNALKRFVARRGAIAHIYSDNGTNFVGASNELKDIYQSLTKQIKTDKPLSSYLLANEIVWHFIPPRSPHFGGLWEAAVKSLKYHLRRVLIETKLTYEQFYTVLCQIESMLNSRPITPLSNDPNDLNPLTPGHFLVGAPLHVIPEQILDGPANRLSAYQHLTQLVQHFWKRWHNEYLHTLQQRSKWREGAAESIRVGTMVLLKDESRHPSQWPLGRVTEVHPGRDAKIRVVSVLTKTGTIKRAINKVCALPNN